MDRLRVYRALLRLLLVVCFATPGAGAIANTITFETAPFGGFSGPVTENGFTYSTLSGGLFVNAFGNPGQNMEGLLTAGGGVLKIVSAGGGDFTFDALDFNFSDLSGVPRTLHVEGFLGGSSVGVDEYTLATPFVYVTETAAVLAGKTISELDISLNASTTPEFTERVDNVVLRPVPEPATVVFLSLGFAAISLARERKVH